MSNEKSLLKQWQEVIRDLELSPELQCIHCGQVFKGQHECDYDHLKQRVAELEEIRKFYADPTIYDAREGMAILKDCGDKAREGLKKCGN